MSEKTALVRLRAITDQYDKAIDKSRKRTEDFAGTKFDKVGTSMANLGSTMTRSVTLPLVALGGVATKMAGDFDEVFVQMQSLAGVAADEIGGLKESVLGLAGETGQAPVELAEALYFIRSAGLDGQDALDALEMSAKGAAIGLGETKVVADVVTSAMNAYGSEVLSAAAATDALVKTAEQGKVEASALAPQFGRLLPVAAELGIRFDEVGAGLAYLTKGSGSAELASTQLGATLAKLLKPSQQGAEMLDEIGMSADSIRESIADKGLLETLIDLRDQLGDNGFTKFLEDQSAIAGALTLTGSQVDAVRGTFEELANSTGALDNSFSIWADSMGAKNKRAFADLQVALIALGDALAPIAADLAKFAGQVVSAFSSLPGPLQKAIIAFGGLAAAAGPLLSLGGNLLKAWRTIGPVLDRAAVGAYNAAGNMRSLSRTLGTGVAVIGTATAAWAMWNQTMDDAKRRGKEQVDTLRDQWAALDQGEVSVNKIDNVLRVLDKDIANLSSTLEGSQAPWDADKRAEMRAAIGEAEAFRGELVQQREALMEAGRAMGLSGDALLEFVLSEEAATAATDENTGAIDGNAAALATQEEQIAEVVAGFEAMESALKAMFDPLFGLQDATLNLADAQEEAARAAREHGAGSDEAREANAAALRAAVDYQAATIRLRAAIEAGTVSIDDAKETLRAWVEQGIITQRQADEAAASFDELGEKANALDGKDVTVHAKAVTAAAEQALDYLTRPRTVWANVQALGGVNLFGNRINFAQGSSPGKAHSGSVIPGTPGSEVPVIAQAGEWIVNPNLRNSTITPSADTMLTPAGAGGGTTTINRTYHITGSAPDARAIRDAIRKIERDGL